MSILKTHEERVERLVEVNVYANVSGMVEFILTHEPDPENNSPFVWDDVENTIDLDNEEEVEVLEWWIVSEWLMHKLQSYGEVVIPHVNVWGRQTSGQSITQDTVIEDITMELTK